MSKRRRYQWPQRCAQFEQSYLTQAEFCKQHDLNPKDFSLKPSKHKASAQHTSAFTHVEVQSESVSSSRLMREVGQYQVHCPNTLPMPVLFSLITALA
ncbi:IS66 family insertion sequence element accessory protein TnpA [Gynuella sunshinyii]|uniref:IS66 family insertion sequence element accessory protein TnpA n=1 Tax=Gynuella sunshinyii TaxID=1445505 RepID=UPI0026802ADF